MIGLGKHVERRHLGEPVARKPGPQDLRIAGERLGIAREVRDAARAGG